MLVEFRSTYGSTPERNTAAILHPAWANLYTVDKLARKVKAMISAGSYYKNIEKTLGIGSVLVLGRDSPETTFVTQLSIENDELTFTDGRSFLGKAEMPSI